MSFLHCYKLKHLQLLVFLAATFFCEIIPATEMGTQWVGMGLGSTLTITLEPPLPRKGESFTINAAGTWRNGCIAEYEDFDVRLSEQYIYLSSSPTLDLPGCENPSPQDGDEYEPTSFARSVVIPSSAWEFIDEKKPLNVRVGLSPSWLMPHYWWRQFDLNWGLHEIHPQIGAGHWISDQRPFQGLNVEQQGDTVLVYDLKYNKDDGQPTWLMGHARFYGDITHGVTYHVSRLNPSTDQPIEDEMSFAHSSIGISVVGVNRMGVRYGVNKGYTIYKRYVFRLADDQLPVVVPNMAGQWNLYAFDDQNLEFYFPVEFRAVTESDRGLGWYRFKSVDDQWVLDCWANLDGVGTCFLTSEDLGITMSYDLTEFNGNYAKAPLLMSDFEDITQTGILLRAGFHLPVLDLQ